MDYRKPNLSLWLAALTACIALFLLTYVALVRSSAGQTFDDSMMVAAQELTKFPAARSGAISFLGWLPEVSAVIAAVALMIAGLGRRSLTAPVTALFAALAAASSTQLLKAVLDRPRLGISEAALNSFPSGHTTVAAAAMFAVVLVSAPRLRPIAATFGGVFAAVAAMATFVLGWHRPSDVIGAILVAAGWALIGGWVILTREPAWNGWEPGSIKAPGARWLALPWVPATVGLILAAAIWALVLRNSERGPTELAAWYVMAGFSFIGGATMLVFGAVAGLLSRETKFVAS